MINGRRGNGVDPRTVRGLLIGKHDPQAATVPWKAQFPPPLQPLARDAFDGTRNVARGSYRWERPPINDALTTSTFVGQIGGIFMPTRMPSPV